MALDSRSGFVGAWPEISSIENPMPEDISHKNACRQEAALRSLSDLHNRGCEGCIEVPPTQTRTTAATSPT